MKHHFADFLDRTGNYWTFTPNRERFAYLADQDIADKGNVKILTISKNHGHWQQVFNCPNLEELTLHDPSKEQVNGIQSLTELKRLRVTFFRATDIEFIGNLPNLEEVILEYVSGFSDLSPLRRLTKLRSLYFENLRRVSNFGGLSGINSLKFLDITGTLDWKQPIDDFGFLTGLPKLEVFSLGFIKNDTGFPAFRPILSLNNLRKIKIYPSAFQTKEYAFLQAALPYAEGSDFNLCMDYGTGNFEFLGKRAGSVRKNNPNAQQRCDEFKAYFEQLKKEAVEVIENQ